MIQARGGGELILVVQLAPVALYPGGAADRAFRREL
jgi:hypothetical protein